MPIRILVTLPLPHPLREQLRAQLVGHEIRFGSVTDQPALVHWADCVLGNVSREIILPRERSIWIHSPNASLDAYANVDNPMVQLTNSVGVAADPVAEHAIALLFALTRNVPLLCEAQRRKSWARAEFAAAGQGAVLVDKQVHVFGYGLIARSLIRRLGALGMEVVVFRRQATGQDPMVRKFVALDDRHRKLAEADVVVDLLPAATGTERLFDSATFGAMRPGTYFLNLGRGSTVDEAALVQALRSGRVRAAALDVFVDEPLDAKSPLWELPVLVSPHVAGRFDNESACHIRNFCDEFKSRVKNGRFTI